MSSLSFLLFGSPSGSDISNNNNTRPYRRNPLFYPQDSIRARPTGSLRFEGEITSQKEEQYQLLHGSNATITSSKSLRVLDETVEVTSVSDYDRSRALSYWNRAYYTSLASSIGLGLLSGVSFYFGSKAKGEIDQKQPHLPLHQNSNMLFLSSGLAFALSLFSAYRTIDAGGASNEWKDPLPGIVKNRKAIGLPTTGYETIYLNRGFGVIAAPNEVHHAFHTSLQSFKEEASELLKQDSLSAITISGSLDSIRGVIDRRFKFVKDFVSLCPLEPSRLNYARFEDETMKTILGNYSGKFKELSNQLTQATHIHELEVKNVRLEAQVNKDHAERLSSAVAGALGGMVDAVCVEKAKRQYSALERENNRTFDKEITEAANRRCGTVSEIRERNDRRMKDLKEQFEKDLAICGVNALGLSSVALAAGEVSKNSIERNAREKEHALKLSFKAGIATELLPRVHNMLDDLQKNVPKK